MLHRLDRFWVGADQDQGAAGVDCHDCKARVTGRPKTDQLRQGGILQPWNDVLDAVDSATGQVFQTVVDVQPAAALPDLYQPGPDAIRWGKDGDGAGLAEDKRRHQLIAGKWPFDFVVRCSQWL